MTLRELILMPLSKVTFKHEKVFRLFISFSWGQVDSMQITEYGKFGWEKNKDESEVELHVPHSESWSHGCNALSIFFKADNITNFATKAQELGVILAMTHKQTLEREKTNYANADLELAKLKIE